MATYIVITISFTSSKHSLSPFLPADNGRRRGRRRPAENTRPTKDQEPKLLKHGIGTEKGFSETWPRHILPSISPGPDLDAINRKAIQVFADETEKLRTQGSQLVPVAVIAVILRLLFPDLY
ncbi:hypothetical protein V8F06_009800 [Rhypophila decipiens]